VLAVDDYEVNLDVLAGQLDLLGVAVDLARDGLEALDRWRSGHYALVLTDIHMPDMDGFELTRQIRAEERGRGLAVRTPVVALTANALKGEAERCLAAGMDDYLTKPLTLDRLRAALDRWMSVMPGATAPDVAAGAPPAIDTSALALLFGDNPALAARLMAHFRDSGAQLMAALGTHAATGDLRATAEIAHKLKGAARMAGAHMLGDLAETLEHDARDGHAADSRGQADRIAAEWRRVSAELPAATAMSEERGRPMAE
jgi:CheY-like chemotaxis protein/HPt (histidine-containing phosphotransfer) domain-containing protein